MTQPDFLTPLHEALLDLGREDWIPLWEAVEVARSEGLLDAEQPVAAVGNALVDLLRAERIQVCSGPWQDERPSRVRSESAEGLLLDERRYLAETEPDGERVYFVNVENVI